MAGPVAGVFLGAGALVPAGIVVAVGVVGAAAYFALKAPEEAAVEPAAPEVVETAQPAPEVVAEAAPEDVPDDVPEPDPETEVAEAPVALAAPEFDVVRVDDDGAALIAGLAEPGETVDVMLDDALLGQGVADGAGRFVTFLEIAPSEDARTMTLIARPADGDARPSEQTIIITPFAAPPVAMAEAPIAAPEPEAAPEAAPEATPEVAADVEVAEATPEPAPEPEAVAEPAAEPEEEPTTPTILLAENDSVRVLQSPEAMTSVALDTITYNNTGDVALGGRAPSDGFVRVYLDGQAITTSPIAEDGSWETDLPQVDAGVYTLRVDQLTETGEVESRIETPFKREEPELVVALAEEPVETGPIDEPVMTVQPGATLWAIARDRYGSGAQFVKVFEANRDRIANPDLIYPGQVFDLPEG